MNYGFTARCSNESRKWESEGKGRGGGGKSENEEAVGPKSAIT